MYFSTLWADSSHTCSSSYLEEGTKPELGHWFELILDPLAILNQLLSCESGLQLQTEVEIVVTKGLLQVDHIFLTLKIYKITLEKRESV